MTPVSFRENYINDSLMGAQRALIGLPFEHPFDAIKTYCQAKHGQLSTLHIIRKLWECHGIRGFYSGVIPNGLRAAMKQAYRYPMQLAFPDAYRQVLPTAVTKKWPTSVEVCTGLTIAVLEVGLICPLERLKVYLMTSDKKQGALRQFVRESRTPIGQEMMRGIRPLFAQKITSWSTFLVTQKKVMDWEQERTQTKDLSIQSVLLVSTIVGTVNTLWTMPFDYLKTCAQKKDWSSNPGLYKWLKSAYQTHGISALYSGWQMKMIQYTINSLLTIKPIEECKRQRQFTNSDERPK